MELPSEMALAELPAEGREMEDTDAQIKLRLCQQARYHGRKMVDGGS